MFTSFIRASEFSKLRTNFAGSLKSAADFPAEVYEMRKHKLLLQQSKVKKMHFRLYFYCVQSTDTVLQFMHSSQVHRFSFMLLLQWSHSWIKNTIKGINDKLLADIITGLPLSFG